MKIALVGVMIGAATLLSGCDNSDKNPVPIEKPIVLEQPQEQPQVVYEQVPQQQPNVVVVQQPPVYNNNHSGIGSHLAAGALGYMVGRHSGRNSSAGTRKEVHHYYHQAPSRRYYGSRRRR